MSVYFGSYGQIELKRKTLESTKVSLVNPGDVNAIRKRFSFDFDPGFLNSGDQIQIASTNGALLEFVATSGWLVGQKQTSGSWYINVDELGGIRLYSTFDNAIRGESASAISLETITVDIPIEVTIVNSVPHILAQCTSFELNTNRETVDTTALGEEFRSQYSSLITGSGSLRAFWEYLPAYQNGNTSENAHYILQLATRTEAGSEFGARLYLKTTGITEGGQTALDDEIWYEFDAVISQAGVNFTPTDAVEIRADFVTTGPIRLQTKTTALNKILQQNYDDIRLEQDATASLLQEAVD